MPVRQVIEDLDRLNHSTERDFLKIGGKLAEFIGTVSLISSELTGLANLVSGEQAQRTSQALTCALDHSIQMRASAERDNSLLGGVRQKAGRLKQTLAGFEGTVTTFRTLAVLTRVETGRLGSAGVEFGGLADDVKVTAANIQTRVETALATGAHLIPSIETALRNAATLREGQTEDLPGLISGALASLSSFRDIQTRTHGASVRLGVQYDAISESFKKLIVSLQFHDITRQQVEHVMDALRRLGSESGPESGGISADPGGAALVLALQSMQLADAGEKFAALAASVAHNLDQIAAHVLEMAGESQTLFGLSTDETNSFFLQIERGCAGILASLSQCASSQTAVRVASGGLAETIARMRGPIEEIKAIESQMRRIAINGRISAGHLGAAGSALDVLADSVQQLASECGERSATLAETLGSMSEAATGLSSQGGPADDPTSQAGCLEAMRTAVGELHSSSQHSSVQITGIIASCGRLREDLSAARESFSVGAVFAEAVSRAQGALQEIGNKEQSGLSRDETEALKRGLADLARRYTMQAERDVHEDLIKGAAGATPAAVPAEPTAFLPEEASELGDNVEFF